MPFDLVNIIEDCRIEKLMGKKYPGCKMNLEYVNENVTKDHVLGMQMAMSLGKELSPGKISAMSLHVCMGKAMGHTCFEQIISYLGSVRIFVSRRWTIGGAVTPPLHCI